MSNGRVAHMPVHRAKASDGTEFTVIMDDNGNYRISQDGELIEAIYYPPDGKDACIRLCDKLAKELGPDLN